MRASRLLHQSYCTTCDSYHTRKNNYRAERVATKQTPGSRVHLTRMIVRRPALARLVSKGDVVASLPNRGQETTHRSNRVGFFSSRCFSQSLASSIPPLEPHLDAPVSLPTPTSRGTARIRDGAAALRLVPSVTTCTGITAKIYSARRVNHTC